jgi:hypothetical protein
MILHRLLVASLLSLTANAGVGDTVITVRADKKLFTLSEMMIGANMEDLHYQMVGGFDGQMLHGESFFEHSPTELAPRKAQLDGFATVNGVWTVADGVVTVTVRPDDGTPWLETGLAGGQPYSLRTFWGVILRFLLSTTCGIRCGCKSLSAFRS